MPISLRETPLPHYVSPLLRVPHAMFCRAGGTSDEPFAALNLGDHFGDVAERVRVNRERALAALGLQRLVAVKQVHADRVLTVDPSHGDASPEGYDAMISTLRGTGLLIQQADCQAILLAAPDQGVVAAIHCGWRGSVQDIIGTTIRCLRERHGLSPAALTAAISPSLGPCCAEFVNYRHELPAWMHDYQVRPLYFDFWAISGQQLAASGVRPENIDIAGLCTCCSLQFFSYRRAVKTANGVTGRNGSIIGLPA